MLSHIGIIVRIVGKALRCLIVIVNIPCYVKRVWKLGRRTKMKIIKQGYNECVLATLAMLADKPLYKARAIARNVAEEQEGLSMPWFTWDGYFCCVSYFPETPEGTNKQRRYAQKIIERLNVIGFSPITRSKYEDLKGVRETPPCLAGKGQLSIRIVSELTLRERGHSTAYENWNVYE